MSLVEKAKRLLDDLQNGYVREVTEPTWRMNQDEVRHLCQAVIESQYLISQLSGFAFKNWCIDVGEIEAGCESWLDKYSQEDKE